jgi:exodeoxyribonuclease VII small subunit
MSNRKRQPASKDPAEDNWLKETQQLTFAQSRTALDLTLAALQSEDLEVEAMAGLYRQAVAYADRCVQVLEQVQQQVEELDLNSLQS